MKFSRVCFRTLAFLVFCFSSYQALGLTCQQVRNLTSLYLKYHYSFDSFDDELSKRTLDNMVKAWDPGKLYFYKRDVEDFQKKYAANLDDKINKGDCSPMTDMNNVFAQRFEERHKYVNTLIDAKYDFSVDESLSLDRKKIEFAANSEELNERWRKRVKFQFLQLKPTLGEMNKIKEKVAKRYNNVVKWQNEKTIDDVYSIFLNSFSLALDPHSEYMMPEQLEDFRIDTKLSLEGIGAVLRNEDGFTIIQSLVPGGAASKTEKVKVDDKIIAVAQGDGEPVDVIDMQLREVVRLIRGTAGTIVRLTLLREEGGKTTKLDVHVKREKVQLEDRVAKSKVYEVEVKEDGNAPAKMMKIGVLDLPSFYVDFEGMHEQRANYRSSYRDTLAEIQKLEKANIDAMIVDLRSNGGGSLDESEKIAGLFFDKGPVVQIKEMDGKVRADSDPNPGTVYAGPLLLMINRQSASASEILAGAIQDYQRGLIVGDSHTFGKGTVQNLQDLGDKLGAVKITISKFYRPSGSSTQLRGVESDVILPGIVDELEIGEKHYDYALPWDQIPSSSYTSVGMTKPYISELNKRSKDRLQKDPFFDKVRDEIQKYKDAEKDRYVVSLKEKKEGEASKSDVDEEEAEELATPSKERKLEDDPTLQETLRIAADYVRMLKKEKPAIVALPNLKLPKKVEVAQDKGAAKAGDVAADVGGAPAPKGARAKTPPDAVNKAK